MSHLKSWTSLYLYLSLQLTDNNCYGQSAFQAADASKMASATIVVAITVVANLLIYVNLTISTWQLPSITAAVITATVAVV